MKRQSVNSLKMGKGREAGKMRAMGGERKSFLESSWEISGDRTDRAKSAYRDTLAFLRGS